MRMNESQWKCSVIALLFRTEQHKKQAVFYNPSYFVKFYIADSARCIYFMTATVVVPKINVVPEPCGYFIHVKHKESE